MRAAYLWQCNAAQISSTPGSEMWQHKVQSIEEGSAGAHCCPTTCRRSLDNTDLSRLISQAVPWVSSCVVYLSQNFGSYDPAGQA